MARLTVRASGRDSTVRGDSIRDFQTVQRTTRTSVEAIIQADPNATTTRTSVEAIIQADPNMVTTRTSIEVVLFGEGGAPFRGWGVQRVGT